MFGILFFVFMTICGILAACRMAGMDYQMYKYQKENPSEGFEDYWTDASGHDIARKTGRPCSRGKWLNGHDCLIDSKTLNVIRDYTEEKNERVKELVMNSSDPGITAYMYIPMSDLNKPLEIKGNRYIDKATGEEYVVRTMEIDIEGEMFPRECDFFMSVKTGYLVRPTDQQNERWKEKPEAESAWIKKSEADLYLNHFVSDFNHKQEIDRKNENDSDFINHFYFNKNADEDSKLFMIYYKEDLYPKEVTYSH